MLNGLFAALASPNGLAFGPIAGGRLGDYASEGQLQNIISDLLQQAGGHTGPPPMSEEAIAALPRRNLTDKDIAAMTRRVCDVCKVRLPSVDAAAESRRTTSSLAPT